MPTLRVHDRLAVRRADLRRAFPLLRTRANDDLTAKPPSNDLVSPHIVRFDVLAILSQTLTRAIQ